MLEKSEALETLQKLSDLRRPVWLAGGLAADFLVGRWTRDHGDIDLVAWEDDRKALTEELAEIGFTQTDDRGWITRWTCRDREVGEVSLAFLRRVDATTGQLVILPEDADANLVPGVYPGVPGNMDPEHFRSLEGVRWRVMSAADEWVYAKGFRTLRPSAGDRPEVQHNLALLETILTEADRERLLPLVGRRLSLESEKPG